MRRFNINEIIEKGDEWILATVAVVMPVIAVMSML